MPSILLLSGSPAATSRSHALLEYARRHFVDAGLKADLLGLRDFPAEDLVFAKYDSPAFENLKYLLADAAAVVVATPVYKAAYSGGLKAILDVLPQTALREKTVLPLATGGSPAHQLSIDYALKPVLSALGATDLLQGVYIVDKQLKVLPDGELEFADSELRDRFHHAVAHLTGLVAAPSPSL
ncbi:MAG TPA: NADPH-dependent FMN reductase [Opitutaceae bacterium]